MRFIKVGAHRRRFPENKKKFDVGGGVGDKKDDLAVLSGVAPASSTSIPVERGRGAGNSPEAPKPLNLSAPAVTKPASSSALSALTAPLGALAGKAVSGSGDTGGDTGGELADAKPLKEMTWGDVGKSVARDSGGTPIGMMGALAGAALKRFLNNRKFQTQERSGVSPDQQMQVRGTVNADPYGGGPDHYGPEPNLSRPAGSENREPETEPIETDFDLMAEGGKVTPTNDVTPGRAGRPQRQFAGNRWGAPPSPGAGPMAPPAPPAGAVPPAAPASPSLAAGPPPGASSLGALPPGARGGPPPGGSSFGPMAGPPPGGPGPGGPQAQMFGAMAGGPPGMGGPPPGGPPPGMGGPPPGGPPPGGSSFGALPPGASFGGPPPGGPPPGPPPGMGGPPPGGPPPGGSSLGPMAGPPPGGPGPGMATPPPGGPPPGASLNALGAAPGGGMGNQQAAQQAALQAALAQQSLGGMRFAEGGAVEDKEGASPRAKGSRERQWGDVGKAAEDLPPERKAKGGKVKKRAPFGKGAAKKAKATPPPVPMVTDGDMDAPPPPMAAAGPPSPMAMPAGPPPPPAPPPGMKEGGKCEGMAAGGVAKLRRGFPNTEKKPKRLAKGGTVRGCGAATKGKRFSGIY